MNKKEVANVFKALSDQGRLEIIENLSRGEMCACELLDELKYSQSGLSYQMKILCDSGIVKARPEGKWIHYSIDREGCREAVEILKKVTGI